MSDKKDFFVSYNRNDRGWAEWIAWQLEEAGYTTVLQAWDFGAGSDFVIQMQEAATRCERTVGVLSPDSVTAPFVRKEWAAALANDPTGEKCKLILTRVRECKPEGLYRALIYIDLVGLLPDAAKERLLGGLTPQRRKPALPPRFPGAAPSVFSPSGPPTQTSARPLAPSYFPGKTIRVFLCVAPEDLAHAATLRKHLSFAEQNGVMRIWHAGEILAGMRECEETETHFVEAQMVVLLITHHFLASVQCMDYLNQAQLRTGLRTIPVLVGPSVFDETSLGGALTLPRSGVPITSLPHPNEGWAAIAKELLGLAKSAV